MKIKLKVKKRSERVGQRNDGSQWRKVGLLNENDGRWYGVFIEEKNKWTLEYDRLKEGDEIECYVMKKDNFWNIVEPQATNMLWEEIKMLSTRVSTVEIAVRELQTGVSARDLAGVDEKRHHELTDKEKEEYAKTREKAEAEEIVEDTQQEMDF